MTQRKRLRRISFYLIYLGLVTLFFEFVFRLYFSISLENPKLLLTPSSLIEEYYPGIEEALSEQINYNNDTIDILLLGASVLHPIWGTIEQELQNELTSTYPCKVNITNLSKHSHTSMDSKIKYDLLQDQKYDVVLLYHGIN